MSNLPSESLERGLLHWVSNESPILEKDKRMRGSEGKGRLLGSLLNGNELLGVGGAAKRGARPCQLRSM